MWQSFALEKNINNGMLHLTQVTELHQDPYKVKKSLPDERVPPDGLLS